MNKNFDILIIEDSKTQAENLKFILESHNYTVWHVLNGKEALETLTQFTPKIIISDIIMPQMDGFTLCSRVKADNRLKGIPFILLTSLSDAEDIIKGLVSGADSFITKPFDTEFLLSKIKYLILNFELRHNQSAEMGLEILFGGRKHLITSDRLQILDLLISTYESAVIKNKELQNSNSELQQSKNEVAQFSKNLEKIVEQRTLELQLTNEKLSKEIDERILAEKKQNLTVRILSILNRPNEWNNLVKDILSEIKQFSGIEAVAIRLQLGDDDPYFDTNGFSHNFIESERSLCIKDVKENIVFDGNGRPKLDCMCGTVISGNTNAQYSYFTKTGSFWTNCTTKLLATITEKERQSFTRNRCNKEGYESVALIPVMSGKLRIGLIQLNDKRPDCFTPDSIHFFEEIATTIGIAYKRVQYEIQVKESEERYRQLINNMGEGIGITDNDENFIFVNPAAERIFGVEPGELIGTSLRRFLSPEYFEMVQNQTQERRDKKQSNSYELDISLLSGEKKRIIVTATPKIDKKGELEGIFGIFRDITERKLAEDALFNERKMLRTLIDNLPDSIYVKDTQGRKLIANPADLKLIYAENESEVLGKTDLELFPGKVGIRGHNDDMQIIKNGNAIINKNENFVDKEGQLIWILTTKVPLFDESGKTTGLVGIGHDITKQIRVEKELKKALEKAQEADRLKTTFLATMSHELRTPLNAVIGFSGLIEKDTDLKDVLEYSDMINTSGNQLLEIVENILDFSLIETGIVHFKKMEFSLIMMMDDLHKRALSQREKINKSEIDIIFKPDHREKSLILHTDQHRIQQVLTLLINNALKFTKKGSIEFGYSKIEFEGIPVVKFYVKDTGIGIPKDKQEIIFNMFRQVDESNTREYGGTGLGLAISKRLVEILGGEIWVESNPGEGSVFYFMIPTNIEDANEIVNQNNLEMID
jgi:PAS domain S-box-containing protein